MYPHQETLGQEAWLECAIPGVPIDRVQLRGTSLLGWSDPIPSGPYLITESRLLALDLQADDPQAVTVRLRAGGPASLGMARSLAPDPFPAESFFDVFLEIEFPDALPGVVLHNANPVHVSATIRQYPPFFVPHATVLDVVVPLFDQLGEPRGEIRAWSETAIPWSPPRAWIEVPTCYGTDEAEQDGMGRIQVSGFVSGLAEPDLATFSWRPGFSAGPWTVFGIDPDGSAPAASTLYEEGEGDGWTAPFDVMGFDPAGEYVDFRVEFSVPGIGTLADSVTRYVDPLPLVPEIVSCPPESLLAGRPWSLKELLVRLAELSVRVKSVEAWIYPFGTDRHRALTPVDQFDLSEGQTSKLDEVSCGPTAVASCLKYFADSDDRYEGLEHPGGDRNKPAQSPEDIARELRTDMKTRLPQPPRTPGGPPRPGGTSNPGMMSGVKAYLARHGQSGWSVANPKIKGYSDVANMFRDFDADGEDVIMELQGPPGPDGKRERHYVTLGSKRSHVYHVSTPQYDAMGVSYRLDFMDPSNGGPTTEHEYDIGQDAEGRPVVNGYKGLDDNPPWPRILSYIKISPPATPRRAPPGAMAALDLAPGWVRVDSVAASGNGIVDTLHWDMAGMEPGLYLVMVVATAPNGRANSVIRLGGISEGEVGGIADGVPGSTGIRGAYPNPTTRATTLEFALQSTGPIELVIHDLRGRRIRTLVAGSTYAAGMHRLSWDGRNDEGIETPSGIFFCRLRAGDRTSDWKVVRLAPSGSK